MRDLEYFYQTERLGLRCLRESDCQKGYGKWFNDEIVCEYNSHHRFPKTVDELEKYIGEVNKNNSSVLVFAIIELTSQKHIGNIALQEINYIDRNAELAFIFGEKEYWNKGYATEAAEVVIKHAFDELNLHRLYLGTSKANIAMQKLAEKLGFIKEGDRKQALYKSGKYYDIVEYGMLRQ